MKRIYESRVVDSRTGVIIGFTSIGYDSVAEDDAAFLERPETFMQRVGVNPIRSVSISDLIPTLAYILYASEQSIYIEEPEFARRDTIDRLFNLLSSDERSEERAQAESKYLEFAGRLAFSPVIPVETSPISGKSIGEIVARSADFGAVPVAYVVSDRRPLTLLVITGSYIVTMYVLRPFFQGFGVPWFAYGEYQGARLLKKLSPDFDYIQDGTEEPPDDESLPP